MACTYMKTHSHACTCSHTIIYACRCTLIYAHTEGPQCSGHLQYWTQTQACTLYLHVNGLQQSAAPLVCFVPPAVWAWGRELLVRWGDHIRWAPMVMEPNAAKRGKRGREEAACLAATETAGTPTYHGNGPWFGLHLWLESRGRCAQDQAKGLPVWDWDHRRSILKESSFQSHNKWGQSGLREDGWEPGVLLVGRGVIFDKCICGCGGVGVNDKKLRTAVSMHIQVTWWKDGACLYLFLVIVCRVFACPSVLAGQTRWRSRHMDQTFCPSACFKVHLMVVDLDRTHQLRQAGSIPSVNGPDFEFWHILSHRGHLKIVTFSSVVWWGTCSLSSEWKKKKKKKVWLTCQN